MRLASTLAAALAALPLTALAEQIGSITAAIDGGAETTWYLEAQGDESQSLAMQSGGIPAVNLALWGNPTAGKLAEVNGALLIGFIAQTGGGAALAPEIQYLENSYSGFWIALDEPAAKISLEELTMGDGSVAVRGSFEANLAFTDDPATLATDPDRRKAVAGHFEAVLPLQ
ncbi:MAG: hypothetical protein KDK10_03455 [Maritimibacter sp.]|nr:hypothetical protein [Maritimibacter sp.]